MIINFKKWNSVRTNQQVTDLPLNNSLMPHYNPHLVGYVMRIIKIIKHELFNGNPYKNIKK